MSTKPESIQNCNTAGCEEYNEDDESFWYSSGNPFFQIVYRGVYSQQTMLVWQTAFIVPYSRYGITSTCAQPYISGGYAYLRRGCFSGQCMCTGDNPNGNPNYGTGALYFVARQPA